MKLHPFILVLGLATSALGSVAAHAETVSVASFNLDWWVEKPDFVRLLQACATSPESVPEGLPPCNVYPVSQGGKTILQPTEQYWDAKRAALRASVARTDADVLALEEVSGIAAARTVVGSAADPYVFCETALRDPAVPEAQRLVVAARQAVFQSLSCRTAEAVRVQDAQTRRYMRPALVAELRTHSGKALKVLAVHLKAKCANPSGDENYTFQGDMLTNTSNPDCATLRAQVAPLERLIEAEVTADVPVVMLGDFNRKIHLELDLRAAPTRADGSNAQGVPEASTPVRLLWPEINDGDPSESKLHILPTERKSSDCTGFDGLDHITVSNSLMAANPQVRAEHVPMATFGKDLNISASDHCPLRVRLRLP